MRHCGECFFENLAAQIKMAVPILAVILGAKKGRVLDWLDAGRAVLDIRFNLQGNG